MSDKVAAEVAKRKLRAPDGSEQDCWIVTAVEIEAVEDDEGTEITPAEIFQLVFSGYRASERAVAYAREHYHPLYFRISAEPGEYRFRAARLEARLNGEGH